METYALDGGVYPHWRSLPALAKSPTRFRKRIRVHQTKGGSTPRTNATPENGFELVKTKVVAPTHNDLAP
jgi:hypothetical protein